MTTVPTAARQHAGRGRLTRVGERLARVVDGRSLLLFAATVIGYEIVARASLLFVLRAVNVAGAWPAAGIAVGLLMVTSPRRWPAIVLGVAAGSAVANLDAGVAPRMAAGFVLANTLGPLVAAAALQRAGVVALTTLREVGLFIAFGGLVGPIVAATIGAASAAIGADAHLVPAFLSWLLADAGGVLAVAPLILLAPRMYGLRPPPGRLLEAAAIAAGVIGLTTIAFLPTPIGIQLAASPVFLLVVLASLRFGVTGATLTTVTIAILATIGTIAGYGPVAHLNTAAPIRIGQLQIFVAVTFLVSFVTAAAMAERHGAEKDLEAQRAREAERARLNERIAAFAREIARSLDSDAVFRHIARSALEVVPSDMAVLTVAVGGGGPHRIVAAPGAPGAIGRTIVPGDGFIGSVVRDGEARVAARVDPAERASTTHDVMPDQPLALACAPVLAEGSVVATLSLGRLDLASPFGSDEARALQMMADLVALALRNVGEYERAQDRAIRDEVTGLPNRRYFTTSFEQLAAQRARLAPDARVPVSAVLFDLDHFGAVNKERGHATGDRVLGAFGRLLATRLRRADVVARYGGEEFVAVLVGTDREGAIAVADEIRATFERSSMTGADGEPIHCTVSAGVATTGVEEATMDGLLSTADVALSMAKRAGRNMVSSA